MFRILIAIIFITFCSSIQAQDDATNEIGVLRIDILAPGIGGEIQLQETQTIAGALNIGFAFGSNSTLGNQTESYFVIAPTIHAEYRYFFNREKRIGKGKTVYNNSGLFFGAHVKYNAPELYSSNELFEALDGVAVGPVFGVQRTWNNNLQLGISLGFGYSSITTNDTPIDGVGNFNFSYIFLPKRDKK